jgi:hypothetical protein
MGCTIFSLFLTFFVGKVSGVSLRVRFPGATWAGRFGVGVKKNGVLSLWRGQKSQDSAGNGKTASQRGAVAFRQLIFMTLQTKQTRLGIMFNTMSTHEYTLSIDVVH